MTTGPSDDTLQLGGDAVLGVTGRVCRIHRGTEPDDRPHPQVVLGELRRAAGA